MTIQTMMKRKWLKTTIKQNYSKFVRYALYLDIHMPRHTGERPFKFDLCERAYARIYELIVHRRLHIVEKPFKCKIFYKAF